MIILTWKKTHNNLHFFFVCVCNESKNAASVWEMRSNIIISYAKLKDSYDGFSFIWKQTLEYF